MSGYIKLHRSLLDNEMWRSEPFSRGQAWVDLLMLANHSDGWFRCRGIKVKVNRGQVGHSEVTLSKRWKWSRGKVRRFLSELESETVQQIKQHKTNVTSLITITNYDLYQGCDTANGTANGTASRTANGQQTDINKNEKNEKKKEEYKPTRKRVKALPRPDDVSEQVWSDFIDHRKTKKAPVTETVLSRIRKQAEKAGWSMDDALAEMCMRGWIGLKADWLLSQKEKRLERADEQVAHYHTQTSRLL